ncbi:autorepressor SdpR family transcription factor [Marinilongibacter aquaticus]|uniref:autorepressor SdpR family transcription factor n=1 Tax=Marinilongibacter aquaticus TaxID=2975157 RepID=UPI00286DB1FF|nr:autorepressor SdpR family transcription factor [Marinilongibacter aquaticus]
MITATFKALNDETRRSILELLKNGDMSAGDIANAYNISKPSISHHLDLLKRAGLIKARKEGQFIYYSFQPKPLEEVFKWFVQFKPDEARHLTKPRYRLETV